jgi:hypothetical protein
MLIINGTSNIFFYYYKLLFQFVRKFVIKACNTLDKTFFFKKNDQIL